jgi:hypothetical protein
MAQVRAVRGPFGRESNIRKGFWLLQFFQMVELKKICCRDAVVFDLCVAVIAIADLMSCTGSYIPEQFV